MPILFLADGIVLGFFFVGESKWCHSILYRFVSRSKWCNKFRLLSQYWAKNDLRLYILEAFLMWWIFAELYGLRWYWMLVFPSLKCFTHRLTLLALMHTSSYTHWSLVNISSGNLLFNKKLNDGTLTKRNIIVGHFVSLVCGHVIGYWRHTSLMGQWLALLTKNTQSNYAMLLMTSGLTVEYGTD